MTPSKKIPEKPKTEMGPSTPTPTTEIQKPEVTPVVADKLATTTPSLNTPIQSTTNPTTVIPAVAQPEPAPLGDINEPLGVVSEESSSTKWIVMIVVLVLLIVALTGGAFYYLTQYKYAPKQEILSPLPETTPTQGAGMNEDQQTQDLKKVNSSDEIDAISQDLDQTQLDNIDKESAEIESQLP